MSEPLLVCPPGADNAFGPWAGPGCRGGFDFTLLFEESILTIPLQCLLLLALPIQVLRLFKNQKRVVSSWHAYVKLVVSICLLGLNTTLLALWSLEPRDSNIRTDTSVATLALVFIASLGICMLSWLEHERSARPSFVLSTYYIFSVLFDVARTRTLWMASSSRIIPAVFTSTMALRVAMLAVESFGKAGILAAPFKGSLPKEAMSGTISRSVFFWLFAILNVGYKRQIGLEDLDTLDECMTADSVHRKMGKAWAAVPNKAAPGALLNTWLRVFIGPVLSPVIPRLFQIGFTYAQPFFLNSIIQFAYYPQEQPFNNWGYGLMGAFVIIYLGLTISSGQVSWRQSRVSSQLRTSVVSLIYEKSLKLDLNAPDVTPTAALTLISTDTETISQTVTQLHSIWSSSVEIAVAIYLIWRQLGAACGIPIAFSIIALFITGCVSIPTGTAQAAWFKASEERVSATTKLLGSIKWIKISGLNDMAFNMVQKLRTHELQVSKKFRVLLGITLVLSTLTPVWAPILTFSTYAGMSANGSGGITIAKVFTSYSLLMLLNGPITSLIIVLPTLAGCFTSLQRIQDFLNAKERDDTRTSLLDEKHAQSSPPPSKSDSSVTDVNDECEIVESEKLGATRQDLSKYVATVQGKFSWNEEAGPILDISDWKIRRGTLTFVVGPVGCGKSTLLKTLLGEMAFDGTIRTNYTGVSYCDQSAWIPNDTVRNIIIGGAEYQESWYTEVVRACALEEDIKLWPAGDGTIAGSKGISMSGGQKHRISLARALYARHELLILDNVFSGLDPTTENAIFNALFGKQGLLRSERSTVILATSDVTRSQSADEIVVLSDKGKIREIGTPEQLGSLTDIVESEVALAKEKADEIEEVSGVSKETKALAAPAVVFPKTPEIPLDESRRLGDPQAYKFYYTAVGFNTAVGLFVAMAAYAFCNAFPTVWLGWWAEDNVTNPNGNLGKWLGVYAALGVGSFITIGLSAGQLTLRIIKKCGLYFHQVLLETVGGAPLSFHSDVASGTTINRFSQDLQLIDMELPFAAFGVTSSLAAGLAQFVIIAVSSRYFAASLPAIIIALGATQYYYLRTSRQVRLLDIELKAPLYTRLIETIEGLATIRAFRWEHSFESKTRSVITDSERARYLLAVLQCWLKLFMDLVIMLLGFALVTLVSTEREQIGARATGTGLTNFLAFSNSMHTFITFWVMLEVSLGAVSRVRKFSAHTDAEDADDGPVEEPKDENWPSQGAVEINAATASYGSGTALNNLTLSIKPGQKVAICGRTGSGKSTLMLSLLRLIDLDSGSITIDGVDISTVPRSHLRSKVVGLPQESYIFDGTVRLNVDPAESASDEVMQSTLEKVQLWAKIEERGGLDAVISEGMFSHGETCLLVFARALLRKSRVLLLDEFTSSLDVETSRVMDQEVMAYFKEWTVIAITHKLDSILDFDKVAVLDAGQLVEFDEPRALLERESTFRGLYDSFKNKTG